MAEHKSIAEALAAAQGEMPTIAKTKRANTGQYSYTYASLADVTETAAPVLARHGLAFAGSARHVEGGRYEVVGILSHASGETREGALPITGGNAQQLGSAISYMRRYLFGIMTGVVTDDDDDGALASQQKQAKAQRRRTTSPPQLDGQRGETGEPASTAQVRKLNIALRDAGHDTDEDRYAWLSAGCRRDITSSKELTKAEASRAIEALEKARAAREPEPSPEGDPEPGAPWGEGADQ